MPNTSLKERCTVNTNKDNDTFVGVVCEHGKMEVSFPLGYRLGDSEKELKKDLLLLFNVLSKNTEKKDSRLNKNSSFDENNFPFYAYMHIIQDYFARGYYKEREVVYETRRLGKINWGRTIKTQKAYIQGNNAYYLNFVTQKKNINENELITQIHEFCVYESFHKIGWIFTAYKPTKPRIRFHKKSFVSVVRSKMSQTFNDRNKQLFKNMLAIINSLGDDGIAEDYRIGVNRFERVWESMIDKAYGIVNKSDYFPKTSWHINGEKRQNSDLYPDTIMLYEDKVYVLDAKFYKFGENAQTVNGGLPTSPDINKQITYGEYVEKYLGDRGENKEVFNAFLMPYNCEGNRFGTKEKLHYIGYATSNWKANDGLKPYEKIAGILVDVKTLMQDYSKKEREIMELAELIERILSK